MNKFLIFLFFAFQAKAQLQPHSCMDINRSVGVSMTDAMVEDFGVQESDIVLDKTEMTLLKREKVTEQMANFFAKEDTKEPVLADMKLNELAEIYSESNPTNLIIKYDYVNKAGKHNVLLGSVLINDEECSLRFNGYIIVKREF
ncbi:hypothetical protein ABU178_18495 [Pantoea osteomyelitidis]|uniref:Shiga toxin A subunit n=1 Tax=Pantoea osteomyelitidis TaxID=3230026 RepID=A0ABW7Q0M4_9GAMM